MYKENPKTKGSGIITAIPQTGTCPNNCSDCFFQSSRSYLEPLDENLPNMPSKETYDGFIVRVNDGNDSNVKRDVVLEAVKDIKEKFFNTAIPRNLDTFPGPVVLTINPGKITDSSFFKLDPIPKNLMFVRIRTNMWNLDLVDEAVKYYSEREVPVVLTFMAYFEDQIPNGAQDFYVFRKRTLNSYWAITTDAWESVMNRYKYNLYVHSCGKIEGEKGKTACRFCGNCIREYFVTKSRMKG
jgi:hypothetical protein